ncbi:MAG: anthranilate phosphoribosyltransferase [Calditrichaeota bacterium]|nr:anthranilate phosphoribosyltransferase [Calditrichota bacterium]
MIRTAIQKTVDKQHLSREEAFHAMEAIMKGEATDAQIGALLISLRMKGEQPQEIAGFAESMRKNARPVPLPLSLDAVDLVGTGGDGKHTFNISTVASFVVAGAGVPVAKHGNRSVSSKCGSADVLKALGIHIDIDANQMGQCLEKVGIAFLFAPVLHPAMKHAIGPRREIGVRSVFNILGPITNPAGVRRQLIGVYERSLTTLLAEVLRQLGSRHVLLVHSADGMDEISLAGKTHVVELCDGQIRGYDIDAASFGLTSSADGIGGGDAAENAAIAREILGGNPGPAREVVIANAAAGLYVADAAPDLKAAAAMATESIDSGAALKKLEDLRRCTGMFLN